MQGIIDLPEELKIAAEFWDFLGGEGAYLDLLSCFEDVGIELKPEMDALFAKFALTQSVSPLSETPASELDLNSEL